MYAEEELAGQVIVRIQGWLKQEKIVRGKEFIPCLAVKFCGGCNPTIDRGMLAQAIREALTGSVHWVSWEENPDLVLIINGCLTACADRTVIQKNARASLAIEGNSLSGIEINPTPDESL